MAATWAIGVLVLVLALAGCNGPLSDEYYSRTNVDPQRMREIDAMELARQSDSPPVNVEDLAHDIDDIEVQRPSAPASAELSLADVRSATLVNNLDLQVQLVNPSIAQAVVDAEEAKFDSTFRASYRHSSFDSPTSLATESSLADIDDFSFGLDVPLRTGGLVSIDFPFSRSETNNIFSTLNPAYSSDLGVRISQNLLRDFGPRVQTHSIRVAKYEQQATDARTKLEAIRILANADRAYWLVYATQRELEVRYQQYELAREQLEAARRKVTAGEVAEIEVTRAESGLASRLEAIIIARTAVRQAERDLKRIMQRDDLPIGGETALVLGTDPAPVGLDIDAHRLSDFAVANRMEMLELELQLAADYSTIDFQRNQALPLLLVDYSYNLNGLGSTLDDSLSQLSDASFRDWSVGLRAEIPIGNEAAEARVHQAILQRLQRLATRDLREQAIRQEVFDAVDRLEQNWRRILAARLATILAQRTYEAEKRQFGQDLRTSTDVLDAATQLADAQSSEIRALADYQITQVDIAFATGTLLGSQRVQWDAIDEQSSPYAGQSEE